MVDVILGLQWGDEGKVKIVDFFAKDYDVIARFQGGQTPAIHYMWTIRKLYFTKYPSGVFHEDVINLIGNGVVLDPVTLKENAETVASFGIDLQKKLVYI